MYENILSFQDYGLDSCEGSDEDERRRQYIEYVEREEHHTTTIQQQYSYVIHQHSPDPWHPHHAGS